MQTSSRAGSPDWGWSNTIFKRIGDGRSYQATLKVHGAVVAPPSVPAGDAAWARMGQNGPMATGKSTVLCGNHAAMLRSASVRSN